MAHESILTSETETCAKLLAGIWLVLARVI
jgi:hypothetical protein